MYFLFQLQDVVDPAAFLEAIELPQHKGLSTTIIDNAGTMGVMRTAHDVTLVMERTAHYFVFGRTADAFQQ